MLGCCRVTASSVHSCHICRIPNILHSFSFIGVLLHLQCHCCHTCRFKWALRRVQLMIVESLYMSSLCWLFSRLCPELSLHATCVNVYVLCLYIYITFVCTLYAHVCTTFPLCLLGLYGCTRFIIYITYNATYKRQCSNICTHDFMYENMSSLCLCVCIYIRAF